MHQWYILSMTEGVRAKRKCPLFFFFPLAKRFVMMTIGSLRGLWRRRPAQDKRTRQKREGEREN